MTRLIQAVFTEACILCAGDGVAYVVDGKSVSCQCNSGRIPRAWWAAIGKLFNKGKP